jgi:high-affinity nickel-transport protein
MINSILFVLGLGFVLGLKHATDADHLVAVTTIVSEQRSLRRSALVGALWGVGHTAALLAAGVVVILLGYAIPEGVSTGLELAVALMIVLLGARVLYVLMRERRRVHVHAHRHGGRAHTHLHFHDDVDAHAADETFAHDGAAAGHGGAAAGWRPLAVGLVHGLAGSAALTLLVLTEVVRGGSRALGFSYLFVFGLGSIGGMLLMSILIGLPFVLTGARFERINVPVRLAAGLLSVVFGLYYAWVKASGV